MSGPVRALASAPGSVIRVTADALNPGGAKRMANLLKKHGLRPEHAKCPRCGGKITATDGRTFCTPSTRYSITCDDDCEGVFAPSVRLLVRGWAELYSPNGKADR